MEINTEWDFSLTIQTDNFSYRITWLIILALVYIKRVGFYKTFHTQNKLLGKEIQIYFFQIYDYVCFSLKFQCQNNKEENSGL